MRWSVLARYRLSLALVVLMVLATAGVFLFARPEYRGPGSSVHDVKPPSYVSPAAHGWTWPLGTPGFRFGHDEERWNASQIRWNDLAPLRYAARRAHVDPQSLRVVEAERLLPGPRERPFLIVGGRDGAGRTCIGAQPGAGTPRFFCGAELRGRYAIVLASPRPRFATGDRAIFVSGVVAAAVTKVTIATAGTTETIVRGTQRTVRPSGPQTMYDRSAYGHTWGTMVSYIGQPGPWHARIDIYGAHGKLASIPLRFTKPGSYVYCASAFSVSCGSSAQRRS